MTRTSFLALSFLALSGCQDTKTPVSPSAPAATTTTAQSADRDNTAVNVRDRDESAKTPIDQNENKRDVGITADIRKQVVDTKMSVNAQNVKIITQDGKVTLRGPVKSVEEKKKIEEIAAGVAGPGNVDSQLEVEQQP